MLWCRQLEDSYRNIAESYKECKERGWDGLIDDDILKIVAEGGYIHDNGLKGVEKGYKPYYDYLKYGNQGVSDTMSKLSKNDALKMIDDYAEEARIRREENDKKWEREREEEHKRWERESEEFYNQYRREIHEYDYKYVYPIAAKLYQSSSNPTELSDVVLEFAAKGGYIHDNGIDDNVDEGYKEYYNYLKYGIKPYREEPIMIEDNNYETPYSFEYEPYMINNNNYSITFDHEVDTSDSIQMIEEMYNEDNIEEDIDSDEIIDVLSFLSNKIRKVKNTIIHYISNYRPIMNQYTDTIEAVLIE